MTSARAIAAASSAWSNARSAARVTFAPVLMSARATIVRRSSTITHLVCVEPTSTPAANAMCRLLCCGPGLEWPGLHCGRLGELAMGEGFEERVDAIAHLRLREIARVLEVRLDEQRRHAALREIFTHIALAGREQPAALHRVDDERVRVPLLEVAFDLVVALQEVAVGEVPTQQMLGDALQRPVRVVDEAEFP